MPAYRTALVTGVSSGIGLQLGRLLSVQGTRVVAVARDTDRLRGVVDAHGFEALPCDLTVPREVDGLLAAVPDFDLLVNAAGGTTGGRFVELDWRRHEEVLALNLIAPVRLMHHALRRFGRRGGGVLNISSTAALGLSPGLASYGAAKSALWSVSRSVAYELPRDGSVVVTCVAPGPTRTDFRRAAGLGTSSGSFASASAESVARASLSLLERGRVSGMPDARSWLAAGLRRWGPARVVGPLLGRRWSK